MFDLFSIKPSVYGLQLGWHGCRYNVTGAGVLLFKVFAMWCTWAKLALVLCALVTAGAETDTTSAPVSTPADQLEGASEKATTHVPDLVAAEGQLAVATTRSPPRTLDRQAAELAWRSWLQSAESGNQNAPPRRITTKSLFITPLVCRKGQRLDRNGCVEVVTVNKDEHERILLEQLNALFSSPPTGDVLYDYGDDEPGPLQLSIPIGLDPQAAPLQNQEPSAQAQELQPNFVKKDENSPNNDASIEAELELLKLQHSHNNYTDVSGVLNHNVMNTLLHNGDKPKRDSPVDNSTEIKQIVNDTDTGQKELVYGHVNVDPILYQMEHINQQTTSESNDQPTAMKLQSNESLISVSDSEKGNTTDPITEKTKTEVKSNSTSSSDDLNKNKDQSKLNPENDYSDIGEAIKLISRYAEVSTDDNFNKDQRPHDSIEDSILGTRTKLQYRRNKPKPEKFTESLPAQIRAEQAVIDKLLPHSFLPNNEPYYRYPWPSQHYPTPPANYPFRHLQDYWPGKNHVGGVYNTHGNPRRHHHSYPHYLRSGDLYPEPYPRLQEPYPDHYRDYAHRVVQRHAKPSRSQTNNQSLYSLLGLRHWFSSEGISKR